MEQVTGQEAKEEGTELSASGPCPTDVSGRRSKETAAPAELARRSRSRAPGTLRGTSVAFKASPYEPVHMNDA